MTCPACHRETAPEASFCLAGGQAIHDARLGREAQAMGQLGDPPHIVTVHDIGEEKRKGRSSS